VRIDGGTSVDERQTIVDNFNCRGVGQVRAAAPAGTSCSSPCLWFFVATQLLVGTV
jgi:hypothetical protein